MTNLQKKIEEKMQYIIENYTDNEGCQAGTDQCGAKDNEGKFLCPTCLRWNGEEGVPKLHKRVNISGSNMLDFIREAMLAAAKATSIPRNPPEEVLDSIDVYKNLDLETQWIFRNAFTMGWKSALLHQLEEIKQTEEALNKN